jgi:hypothetical protein
VNVEEAFRSDLERCIRTVYQLREEVLNRRSRRLADAILDGERRLLIALSAQLMLAIVAIPWLGPFGVLAGLAVLYTGTFVSAGITFYRVRRVAHRAMADAVDSATDRALATCPAIQNDSRSILIRLINLTTIPPTPRSLDLVRAGVGEARDVPGLWSWPFLHDLAGLFDGPDSRLLLGPDSPADNGMLTRRFADGRLTQSHRRQ